MRCVKIILIALIALSFYLSSARLAFAEVKNKNLDWQQERVNYERKHQSKDYEDALAVEVLQEMISDRD
ncbi:MAG: hypothetical protein IJM40_03355 [Synergistaceae bacterium]|nr:hypothetical protein [Synergistaceae bacterium]